MLHVLKIWPQHFPAVADGRKPFEIRWNDRNYKAGDTAILREFVPCPSCLGKGCSDCLALPDKGTYTGRALHRNITVVSDFAQSQEFVVLGLSPYGIDEAKPSDQP